MRISKIVMIVIIVLSFLVGMYFYPQMPERVASHWNAQGQVDGYMPRFWGMFLMPFLSLGLLLLFMLIPRIDPLKANIEKFRRYYDGFIALLIGFLFYLYLLTILWNSGFRFNMTQWLVPAFAVLLYAVGILTENAKRNWFIGIRTPWTLSDERVWDKTHRVGGRLFKLTGAVALLGVLFQQYALLFVIVPVVLVAAYPVAYSYFEYQRQMNKER